MPCQCDLLYKGVEYMLRIVYEDILTEASYVTFGGQANPPYGWSVCIAGGPGSGKGFVKEKIFLLDFTSFDVDDLKKKFGDNIPMDEAVNGCNLAIGRLNE